MNDITMIAHQSKHPDPVIFHVDVNSAFLSCEACYRLHTLGEMLDIRSIPSVVGGSEESRHGIVLAKSIPAKAFHIQTGEALATARQKCPSLRVFSPNYELYVSSSNAFINLLEALCPKVSQYSIDEAFCDMTGTEGIYGSALLFAEYLKDKIRDELGFTVNIGISTNKLLAKMASDFKKPDLVHTLFPAEIPHKFWPLPVSDLMFVGRSTTSKLHTLGITTIGELAHFDPALLRLHFGKLADVLLSYANGEDSSAFLPLKVKNKGYGNSITVRFDVTDAVAAKLVLLSLTETVGTRIRADKAYISVVAVSITDSDFHRTSHQRCLLSSTNVTESIYHAVCELFDSLWDHKPIRQLGVHTSRATDSVFEQYNLFDLDYYERYSRLNHAVDSIRNRYGEDSVKRACFVNSPQSHMVESVKTMPQQSIL